MTATELENRILEGIGHTATSMQRVAVAEMVRFLSSEDEDALFVLKGFAGTGKTTLMASLVRVMADLQVDTVLLAPTGRAAKVLAEYSNRPAYTIHKEIYRQNAYQGIDTKFSTDFNRHRGALFIVDEASMISGQSQPGMVFGTGDLLEDLLHYVYSGHGCRLMLVGDTAQLPPVGCDESPALNPEYIEGYGMTVFSSCLTEVVRQDAGGILHNATQLRILLANFGYEWPKIKFGGFADIVNVPGGQLIEALEESYAKCGLDDTIVVTRSNKRAGIYNSGIRLRILGCEEPLSGSDRIIVVKNNYFWVGSQEDDEEQTDGQGMTFIANGEGAVVRRFRNVRKVHGFTFADVSLQFPDYDYEEVEASVIMDTLQTEAPALTHAQQEQLFLSVWEDYPEYKLKRDRMRAVRHDPLFNALQIKYGYAVTCHKAQGGQWRHVYVDVGYMTADMLSAEYIRWLYTALTRAKEKVFLVNWPAEQTEYC